MLFIQGQASDATVCVTVDCTGGMWWGDAVLIAAGCCQSLEYISAMGETMMRNAL